MLIYARPSHRRHLEPELEWATPGQLGFDRMRQAEAAQAAKGKGKGDGDGLSAQEAELGRLLNKLTEVKEEEKFANNVMVSIASTADHSLASRSSLPTWTSPTSRHIHHHLPWPQATSSSTSCRTSPKLCSGWWSTRTPFSRRKSETRPSSSGHVTRQRERRKSTGSTLPPRRHRSTRRHWDEVASLPMEWA